MYSRLLSLMLLILAGLPLAAQEVAPLTATGTMVVKPGAPAPTFTCVEEDCDRLAWLPAGASVTVIGAVEGRELRRSPLWYEVQLDCPCFDYESRKLSGAPPADEEGVMSSWNPYWSPDGTRIATVVTGDLYVWDVQSGERLVKEGLNPFSPHDMAWSPDGRRIIIGGYVYPDDVPEQNLLILGADGQLRMTLDGQDGMIRGVAWSHDGTRIAATGTELRIWDVQRGVSLVTVESSAGTVAWSPDDSRIVAGGGMEVELQVRDAASGTVLDSLGRTGPVSHIAWSPDGTRIAYTGHKGDRPYGALYVWDRTSQDRPDSLAESSWGLDASWSPDGRFLVSTVDSVVSILDPADGRVLASLTTERDFVGGFLGHVAWSPGGNQIAASGIGDGMGTSAWVWDLTLVPEGQPPAWIHSSQLRDEKPVG